LNTKSAHLPNGIGYSADLYDCVLLVLGLELVL